MAIVSLSIVARFTKALKEPRKCWQYFLQLLARNTTLHRDNHGKCFTMVSSLHHVSSAVLPIVRRGVSKFFTNN